MNKTFILVFILLATLSVVNAVPHQLHKRVTTFNPCISQTDTEQKPLLNVTVTPDPIVAGITESFSVNGILTNDISSTTQLVVLFIDTDQNPLALPYIQPASSTSIKAGTTFSVTASEVPVPPTLPQDYSISVVVAEPAVPADPKKPLNIYACAVFGPQTDTDSAVAASYPVAGPN